MPNSTPNHSPRPADAEFKPAFQQIEGQLAFNEEGEIVDTPGTTIETPDNPENPRVEILSPESAETDKTPEQIRQENLEYQLGALATRYSELIAIVQKQNETVDKQNETIDKQHDLIARQSDHLADIAKLALSGQQARPGVSLATPESTPPAPTIPTAEVAPVKSSAESTAKTPEAQTETPPETESESITTPEAKPKPKSKIESIPYSGDKTPAELEKLSPQELDRETWKWYKDLSTEQRWNLIYGKVEYPPSGFPANMENLSFSKLLERCRVEYYPAHKRLYESPPDSLKSGAKEAGAETKHPAGIFRPNQLHLNEEDLARIKPLTGRFRNFFRSGDTVSQLNDQFIDWFGSCDDQTKQAIEQGIATIPVEFQKTPVGRELMERQKQTLIEARQRTREQLVGKSPEAQQETRAESQQERNDGYDRVIDALGESNIRDVQYDPCEKRFFGSPAAEQLNDIYKTREEAESFLQYFCGTEAWGLHVIGKSKTEITPESKKGSDSFSAETKDTETEQPTPPESESSQQAPETLETPEQRKATRQAMHNRIGFLSRQIGRETDPARREELINEAKVPIDEYLEKFPEEKEKLEALFRANYPLKKPSVPESSSVQTPESTSQHMNEELADLIKAYEIPGSIVNGTSTERTAYLDLLERQLKNLKYQLEVEEAWFAQETSKENIRRQRQNGNNLIKRRKQAEKRIPQLEADINGQDTKILGTKIAIDKLNFRDETVTPASSERPAA